MGLSKRNVCGTAMASLDRPRMYVEKSMMQAEQLECCNGSVAVFAAPSPHKQTPNEDALALIPVNESACVLVIADGVGGMPSGQVASRLAVKILATELSKVGEENGQIMQRILDAIDTINKTLLEQGTGAATTLAIVEIQNDMVRPYHIGDSLILITSVMGTIKFQTVSHSPVGYGIESGLLNESEAVLHEERHLVSNILGTRDMRIEIGPSMKLASRDTLFISSDGFPDNLYIDEIVQQIRKSPLAEVSRNLIDLAGKRMLSESNALPSHPDDHSFIVFRPRASKVRL